MYFLVHGKMGGLAKDLGTPGADIGLKFKENFHVMLLLHSGPPTACHNSHKGICKTSSEVNYLIICNAAAFG